MFNNNTKNILKLRWKIEINTKTAGNSGFERFGHLAYQKTVLYLPKKRINRKIGKAFPKPRKAAERYEPFYRNNAIENNQIIMRDINRIKPILKELENLWLENPDFRIGQLIMGITKTDVTNPKLFYMEDDEFLIKLKEFKNLFEEIKKNKDEY